MEERKENNMSNLSDFAQSARAQIDGGERAALVFVRKNKHNDRQGAPQFIASIMERNHTRVFLGKTANEAAQKALADVSCYDSLLVVQEKARGVPTF